LLAGKPEDPAGDRIVAGARASSNERPRMLLCLHRPPLKPDMVEAHLLTEEFAPEPVVELETGLRMLLSVALSDYRVEWASEEEHAILRGCMDPRPALPPA
jgi:hypothetical protein